MRGQIAQSANTHMMKIGSSVDCKEWWREKCSSYEGSEHLYATTAKFSGCVLLASRPAYSYPPRRQHESYFWTDLVILNCGKMSKTAPELARLSKLPHHTNGRTFVTSTHDLTCNRPAYGGSSVQSGFGPGTLRPRSRNLIIRPLRPHDAYNELN
ncbi:hypothetical protein AVEN_10216-1 [Araneus ventricosus]|uniref:Uncharacterized protein n=1 Tax=Araneus ventricosus TaxID=182803 RepID=A0A4Y2HHD5_ARAVE|nr:hypothetical protein AVEN_10216-1 [Araneus ventricosus]